MRICLQPGNQASRPGVFPINQDFGKANTNPDVTVIGQRQQPVAFTTLAKHSRYRLRP
jgi:hypothetical protein